MVVGPSSIATAPRVSCFRDTCNVYVLHGEDGAVLIDFGDGDVLDHVEGVTDVLLTHHHRDQLGGLQRAIDAGIRVWVPPCEVSLIAGMDERWRRRQLMNDYDVREDRFSLIESVPVTGSVEEYRTGKYGEFDVYTLPTPGHTMGSVTYLVELDGTCVAFAGDLVYGDGRVWSLAATQWTYSGVEGWGATIISAHELRKRQPDVLLPSHGEPVEDPAPALLTLEARMQELIDLRMAKPWSVADRLAQPFHRITPHLWRNRTMFANNYVLLSETNKSLLIDFGYDATTTAVSTEREARRTLLWSVDGLDVEAAVVTHYHDDHVAGLNLLREVKGVEVWAPANVVPIVEQPERYDLPCLWFDPIPVDRVLPLERSFSWHEYEITVYALPGHTRYAAAIGFEVDGKRILVTGDQQTDEGNGISILNYQYRNRFTPQDFVRSADLYRRTRPDLLLGGHWLPFELTDERLERLERDAIRLGELHAALLAPDGFGTAGFGARIEPYRSRPGVTEFEVTVRNPFDRAETARVRLDGQEQHVELDANGEATLTFRVESEGPRRIAVDVTVGDTRFGQQAEAVIE